MNRCYDDIQSFQRFSEGFITQLIGHDKKPYPSLSACKRLSMFWIVNIDIYAIFVLNHLNVFKISSIICTATMMINQLLVMSVISNAKPILNWNAISSNTVMSETMLALILVVLKEPNQKVIWPSTWKSTQIRKTIFVMSVEKDSEPEPVYQSISRDTLRTDHFLATSATELSRSKLL